MSNSRQNLERGSRFETVYLRRTDNNETIAITKHPSGTISVTGPPRGGYYSREPRGYSEIVVTININGDNRVRASTVKVVRNSQGIWDLEIGRPLYYIEMP